MRDPGSSLTWARPSLMWSSSPVIILADSTAGTSILIAHVHLPVIIRLKSLLTRCVAMASLLQAYYERG